MGEFLEADVLARLFELVGDVIPRFQMPDGTGCANTVAELLCQVQPRTVLIEGLAGRDGCRRWGGLLLLGAGPNRGCGYCADQRDAEPAERLPSSKLSIVLPLRVLWICDLSHTLK